MIEERGRVVALEPGAVWVETRRQSTCGSCSAKAGCGHGVLQQLGFRERYARVRALSDLDLQLGDSVVIGVREDTLVRGSLMVYLLPLLGLFAAAVLVEQMAVDERWVILSALLGFVVAGGVVRWRNRFWVNDAAMQPVVLRAYLAVGATEY
ncbi:SoxR reducing system RseC family protein [Ectopseudomonas mendocina]|uniref:SoxR reducing system RseC family protein n=1 Tax=Ectopseudomonas mendocina TaxID=300 RepID=A0ABZ2RII8_ECTME